MNLLKGHLHHPRSSVFRFSVCAFLVIFLQDRPFVDGIQCFSCDAAHINWQCNGTENIRQCPITYDTCQTMIRYSSEVGKLQISKRCSKRDSCATQIQALESHAPCNANHTPEWACTSCCDTDLCNVNVGSPGGRLASACLLLELLLLTISIFIGKHLYSS